jgi:hypothetical protein
MCPCPLTVTVCGTDPQLRRPLLRHLAPQPHVLSCAHRSERLGVFAVRRRHSCESLHCDAQLVEGAAPTVPDVTAALAIKALVYTAREECLSQVRSGMLSDYSAGATFGSGTLNPAPRRAERRRHTTAAGCRLGTAPISSVLSRDWGRGLIFKTRRHGSARGSRLRLHAKPTANRKADLSTNRRPASDTARARCISATAAPYRYIVRCNLPVGEHFEEGEAEL